MALLILLVAGCGSGDSVEASAGPTVESVVSAPTSLPTTAPMPGATSTVVPPTPVALVEPSTPSTEPTVTTEPIASELGAESEVEPPATAVSETVAPAATPSEPAATALPAAIATDESSPEVLIANGGEVYTLNCARCHGENGFGSAQYNGLLNVGNKYTTAGMIDELTNGHPVTFGFADRLSADEIASVVAYVKATFP